MLQYQKVCIYLNTLKRIFDKILSILHNCIYNVDHFVVYTIECIL